MDIYTATPEERAAIAQGEAARTSQFRIRADAMEAWLCQWFNWNRKEPASPAGRHAAHAFRQRHAQFWDANPGRAQVEFWLRPPPLGFDALEADCAVAREAVAAAEAEWVAGAPVRAQAALDAWDAAHPNGWFANGDDRPAGRGSWQLPVAPLAVNSAMTLGEALTAMGIAHPQRRRWLAAPHWSRKESFPAGIPGPSGYGGLSRLTWHTRQDPVEGDRRIVAEGTSVHPQIGQGPADPVWWTETRRGGAWVYDESPAGDPGFTEEERALGM